MYDQKNLSITNLFWESDTVLTFFTGGTTSGGWQLGYMRLKIVNNKDEVLGDTLYSFKNPPELTAIHKGVGKFGNHYYLAASTNFSVNFRDTNGIRIMKLNNDYTVKWDKEYDFNAWHMAHTVTATKDGGCLITGVEVCATCPVDIKNLYVLKVDSMGYAKDADIVDYIKAVPKSSVSLYPNPGNNTINLKIQGNNKNVIFSLYNIAGKKVLSQQVNAAQTTIKTQYLPTGMYIYELRKNGIVFNRGKWVKQ